MIESRLLEKAELTNYLPHKGRMLLLSRAISWGINPATIASEADMHKDNLFFDPVLGGVPSFVAFELMAQSIAALSGLLGMDHPGQAPKIGMILGVRDFKTDVSLFRAGETLKIEAVEQYRDGNVVAFECVVTTPAGQKIGAVVSAIELDDEQVVDLVRNQI